MRKITKAYCVTFHSDQAQSDRALGSALPPEYLKLPKGLAQTNYQTPNERIVRICFIFCRYSNSRLHFLSAISLKNVSLFEPT